MNTEEKCVSIDQATTFWIFDHAVTEALDELNIEASEDGFLKDAGNLLLGDFLCSLT